MAEKDTTLYPPSQRVKSVVWKYFGYHKNADGSICDNGFPVCKKCGRQVAAQGRNTSNLFAHLRSNHPILFRELRVSPRHSYKYNISSIFLLIFAFSQVTKVTRTIMMSSRDFLLHRRINIKSIKPIVLQQNIVYSK